MQKVEGSSPFIRSSRSPRFSGFGRSGCPGGAIRPEAAREHHAEPLHEAGHRSGSMSSAYRVQSSSNTAGSPPTPPRSTNSPKKRSKPAADDLEDPAGLVAAFQKVCHSPRGLKTRSPGPPRAPRPRAAPPCAPRSRSCTRPRGGDGGAARRARADIGCSTSENRSPVVSPSIMKRTPMLPRKPARPPPGASTRASCVSAISQPSQISRDIGVA